MTTSAFELRDPTGRTIATLSVRDDRLAAMPESREAQALLGYLHARKSAFPWRAASWPAFLAAYAASERNALEDLQVHVGGEAPAAFRLEEFPRRWQLLELLLTGEKSRTEVLAAMRAAALFLEPGEVIDEEDLPTLPGLSGPTLSGDVAALRALGLGFRPLGPQDKRSRQNFKLDPAHLPLLATPADIGALRLAAAVLRDLGLPEAATLEALEARAPAAVRDAAPTPARDRLFTAVNRALDPNVVAALREALATGASLSIGYKPVNGEARRYYVEHPSLMWAEGALYLLGHCPKAHGANAVERNREFRLDRFVAVDGPPVEVKPRTVPKHAALPTFDLELWVAPVFAPRFAPAAGHVKVVHEAADGSKIVRIREAIPLRALRRVLSYGELVRVRKPEFVKAQLRDVLALMQANLDDA